MIKKDKVYELKIEEDDDISGIDSISLVDEPAIEVNWMFFNKVKQEDFHIPDGEDELYLEKLMKYGQSEEEFLAEGWEFVKVIENEKDQFYTTNPNEDSRLDTDYYRVRFKYDLSPNISQSAIIPTTRNFCKTLIQQNRVWRNEDIEAITNDFGDSARMWRGGFNCRHKWFQILYKRTGDIINKSSVNKDKITGPLGVPLPGTPDFVQPNTVTNKTLGNPSPSTIRNLGLSKEDFAKISIDYDDTLSTQRGKDLARRLMNEGNEVIIVTRRRKMDGQSVYRVAEELGIPKDKVFFTEGQLKWRKLKELRVQRHIDNNPDEIDAIKKNAPLIRAEKFEVGVPHYTEDGKLYEGPTHKDADGRLMTGEVHTEDSVYLYHEEELGYDVSTIGGFEDPNIKKKKKKQNMESYSDYPDSVKNNAKAVLKWVDENGWGSCGTDVGKQRANQLANGEPISEETIQRMYSYLSRHKVDLESSKSYDDGCGKLMYDSWGGLSALSWAESKVNSFGKNDMSMQKFAIDSEEKRVVIGPAMVPDYKIYRKDKEGNPYHVYFSADTIKMIAEKYMRNKYLDNNDENHDGTAVKDVYVIESWIKEDMEDKSNKYGYGELPIGTWFVSMKVRNDDVWNKVKQGELNGFSVSGWFEEVAQFCREEMFLKKVAEIIKNIK